MGVFLCNIFHIIFTDISYDCSPIIYAKNSILTYFSSLCLGQSHAQFCVILRTGKRRNLGALMHIARGCASAFVISGWVIGTWHSVLTGKHPSMAFENSKFRTEKLTATKSAYCTSDRLSELSANYNINWNFADKLTLEFVEHNRMGYFWCVKRIF